IRAASTLLKCHISRGYFQVHVEFFTLVRHSPVGTIIGQLEHDLTLLPHKAAEFALVAYATAHVAIVEY
ncbi:MAG: hypothetical protein KDA59_23845, partial [Planctomycetales bacterium]|nr:hypothetical protein [Planctomycetales bacterium]